MSAFSAIWQQRLLDDCDQLYLAYKESTAWSDYMLDSNRGLLREVAQRLSSSDQEIEFKREVYTIDALYVGGPPLFGDHLSYFSRAYAIIEHENEGRIEEEMWKLLFWRAPLKVLISYDWNENRKTTSERRQWLERKVELLNSMHTRVADHIGEDSRTEYLLLIANQHREGEILWRWSTIESTAMNDLEI